MAAAAAGIAVLAIGASPAAAATWFAAPDGAGADPCVQADPCDIYDAVGDAPAGSKIAAVAGTYELAAVLQVKNGIVLQGPYAGPPAVLHGDGTSGAAVVATGTGTRVTDFAIRQSSFGDGTAIGEGAIGDRLDSSTSGSGAGCLPVIGGLLRDSLCASYGGGNGVVVDQSTPGPGSAEMTNVTAVSSGDAHGRGSTRTGDKQRRAPGHRYEHDRLRDGRRARHRPGRLGRLGRRDARGLQLRLGRRRRHRHQRHPTRYERQSDR